MMIFMDPPGHDELRRLVSRAFTPRRVAALEDADARPVRAVPRPAARRRRLRLRRGLRRQDPGDADRCAARRARTRTRTSSASGATCSCGTSRSVSAPRRPPRSGASTAYMAAMVDDRRAHPRDDMVSDLLAAELTRDDGSTRRLDGLRGDGVLLAVAARGQRDDRAPPRLGRGAARAPSRATGEARRRRPTLAPNAVEELLRYEAPSPIQARFVTREVEWHGQKVPQYSKIALLTGSAGRDEREFPDADRFDVARQLRPPRDVRVRHPLLPRGQPGSPRGSRRPRRDARPVPRMGCRRGCGRDGAHVHRARAGARPDHDLDRRPGGSIHGHTRRTRRRRHRRRVGDRARARRAFIAEGMKVVIADVEAGGARRRVRRARRVR